jgi:hypothetical protein
MEPYATLIQQQVGHDVWSVIEDCAYRLSFDLLPERITQVALIDDDFSSSGHFVAAMALRAHLGGEVPLTVIQLQQRIASELAMGRIHGDIWVSEDKAILRAKLGNRGFVDQQGINSHGGNGIDMVYRHMSEVNSLQVHLHHTEGISMTAYMGPAAASESIRQAHEFALLDIPWVHDLYDIQFFSKVIDNLKTFSTLFPDGSLGNH